MKIKRLKRCKFKYDDSLKRPQLLLSRTWGSSILHFYKREALALLKFLLENLGMSFDEINKLGYILDKRWNDLLKKGES